MGYELVFLKKNTSFFFVKILFIYLNLFSERGKGREKERERNIDVRETHHLVASHMPPAGDLSQNPGMCPDKESNWQPFSL